MGGTTMNPAITSPDSSANLKTLLHMGLAGQGVSKTDMNKDSLQSEKPAVHREGSTSRSSGDSFILTAEKTPDDNLLAGFTTGKAGQLGAKQTRMDKMVREHEEKDRPEDGFDGVDFQSGGEFTGSTGSGVSEQRVEQFHQDSVLTNGASDKLLVSCASSDDLQMNYSHANAVLGRVLGGLSPGQNMAVSAHYNNLQAFARKQEESGLRVDKEQLLALSMLADPVLQDNHVLMKACENFLISKEKRDEAKQAESLSIRPVYMELQFQKDGVRDAGGKQLFNVFGDQPMVQPGGSSMMSPHTNQLPGVGGPQVVPIASHPGLIAAASATAAEVTSSLGGEAGMVDSPAMGASDGFPPGGLSSMSPGIPVQPGSETAHTDAAKKAQLVQQDLLGARQIYAQIAAERMKWMMQIWQILSETQTKIMEIIQTVSARSAAARDAMCQMWVKVLGAPENKN